MAAAAIVPSALHAPLAGYAAMSETAVQSVKEHIQAVLQETLGSRSSLLVGETVTLDLDDIFYNSADYSYVVTVQNRSVANVRASAGNLVIGGTRQGTTMVDVIAVPPASSSLQRIHEYFRLNVEPNIELDADGNGYTVQDVARYIKRHPELAGRKEAVRTLLDAAESFIPVPNRPPAGSGPVKLSVQKDGAIGIYLHQFFSDADGDPLTYELVLPSSGAAADVAIEDNGRLSIVGLTTSTAPMTFEVRASDGVAWNDPASITFEITVTASANTAPVAAADEYATGKGETLTVTAESGLLANDYDPDHDSLSAILAEDPAHGSVFLQPDGSFTYTPDSEFIGTDSFTYTAYDGQAYSAETVVEITVNEPAPNGPRIVNAGPGVVAEGNTYYFSGSFAADDDTPDSELIITFTDVPDHGTLTYGSAGMVTIGKQLSNAVITGSGLRYTHDGSETTSDSFAYTVSDGETTIDGSFTFEITPVNDAPVAAPAMYSMYRNTTLTVDASEGLLSYVTDVDSDTLSVANVTTPTSAALHLNSDGSFTFTPYSGYLGNFTFKYQASDGEELSGIETVTITVTDHPPMIQSKQSLVLLNGEDAILSSRNLKYFDPDGSPASITYTLVTPPAHGMLMLNDAVLNPGDTFTQEDINYDRIVYFDGDSDPSAVADSFTFTVTDGMNDEITDTFNIRMHTLVNYGGVNNDGELFIRHGQRYYVDLREIFGDTEGTLEYEIDETSNNMSIAHELSNGVAAFEVVESPSGSIVNFDLKASSNGGIDWMTIPVTVHVAEYTYGIPDQRFLSSSQLEIDIMDYFDLPGDDWIVEVTDQQNGAYTISEYIAEIGRLLLLPVANTSGRSTFDVTIRDNHGGYVTDTFTVDNGNIPNDIGTVILDFDDNPESVDETYVYLEDIFPGSFSFAIIANSAEDNELTAQIIGSQLKLTTYAHTSAVITITAENQAGQTGIYELHVRTNRTPVSVYDEFPYNMGLYPLITVPAGVQGLIDLSEYFTDPDGDPLTYEIYADSDVITIDQSELAEGILRYRIDEPGKTSIGILVNDGFILEPQYCSLDIIATPGNAFIPVVMTGLTEQVALSEFLGDLTGTVYAVMDSSSYLLEKEPGDPLQFDSNTGTLTLERNYYSMGNESITVTFIGTEDSRTFTFVLTGYPILS